MTAAKKLKPEPGVVKRVLVYENRKSDPMFWDASTEALEAGAYLELFQVLDESWHVYDGLDQAEAPFTTRPDGHPDGCMCEVCKAFRHEQKSLPKNEKVRLAQLELYKKAKKGDALSARRLLSERKDSEYEKFEFERVGSASASYPPREWGVIKPCGEAFVAENGVYKWALHGRISTPELRMARPEFGYHPGQKAALEYLSKGGVLRFDPKTKTEVDLGDEVWTFKLRSEGQTDTDWMFRGLGSDSQYAKTGIPILEQGSMKPGKVIHLTEQVCGGCKRDMERFDD